MFQTVFPSIISSRLHIQQQAYVKQLKILGIRRVICSKDHTEGLQILGSIAQNVVTQVTLCLIKLHLQLNKLSLSSLQMEQTFNKSISLNKICPVLYVIICVTTSKLYFIGKFNSSSQNALYWEAA
jgi:hypothetical protein